MKIYDWIVEQKFNDESVIFEIGSHFGIDTEIIYELSNHAKIHCFEPDPRNIEMLKKRGIFARGNGGKACGNETRHAASLH